MAALTEKLRRDIGEILWFGIPGTELTEDTARALCFGVAPEQATAMVGAVILFKRNLKMAPGNGGVDLEALVELNRSLHELGARVAGRGAEDGGSPLWIAVDQEGGRVQRVRQPATVWPPMFSFEELTDLDDGGPMDRVADRAAVEAAIEALAEEVGAAMGEELAALGFDIDFAPVLDVHSNPANPIIGDRAFSRDPDRAAAYAVAFARGLERAGVLGCGKHFPGHGDTSTDSHLVLPRLDHDLARLHEIELVPFRRAIAAGIPMIMTAHVVFSAVEDGVPATLSRRVVTDLLRGELGFDGLVISDDLGMRAIAGHHGTGDAVVRALLAGCDVLPLCNDWSQQIEAHEALLRAAETDSTLRARIAESAERVRRAKRQHRERGLSPGSRKVAEVCGSPANKALAARLAGTS